MGRQCTTCAHPDRASIDEQLVLRAVPLETIAERHGLVRSSLTRHRDDHLPSTLHAAIVEPREQEGPRRVVDRLHDLTGEVETLLEVAKQEGRTSSALAAVRELRGLLELIAKITGELDERTQVAVVNVGTDPEWLRLRGVLMAALAPHPAAQVAVAQALALEVAS